MQSVFLDTSILVKFLIGHPKIQSRILKRCGAADEVRISSVVACEFRRRYLADLEYLVAHCSKFASVADIIQHVLSHIKNLGRRREMATDIVAHLQRLERDGKQFLDVQGFKCLASEFKDQSWRRIKRRLKVTVTRGVGCPAGTVDALECVSGEPITPKGCAEVAKVGSTCSASSEFLKRHKQGALKPIDKALKSTGVSLSPELKKTMKFIAWLPKKQADQVGRRELCKKYGDLTIALESSDCSTFYTVNYRESAVLARALKQNLVILRIHPDHDEVVADHSLSDADWNAKMPG